MENLINLLTKNLLNDKDINSLSLTNEIEVKRSGFNSNKIWQDCFDEAKRNARYQYEISGEPIDNEDVYYKATICFKEKTGIDLNTSELDEIKVKHPIVPKLKAFRNPSGAFYLIMNNIPNKNSTLKKHSIKIGHEVDENQIEFESAEHTIDDFKKYLKNKGVLYSIVSDDGLVIGIDIKYFKIKPINKWTIYDDDIENFDKIIDEIEVKRPNTYDAIIYPHEDSYLITNGEPVKGSLSFIEKTAIDLLLKYDRYRKSDEYWAIVKDSKTHKELFRVKKVNDEYIKYNLNEIDIKRPEKRYKFNPEFQEWIDADWDDIRLDFDDDVADAIWLFNIISPDNKTLGKTDVDNYFKKNKNIWEGDADSFIEFLLNHRIIIHLTSQIIENKLNEPTNLKDAIKSLTQYMISQGMNIEPLPKIITIDDDNENANNILGKTAHYNPNDCSITLYTLNRHPKDILRSYAHEMIHRIQDNDGKLTNVNTTNTNEEGDLPELEKEAYLKGNMTLRNWEDSIKNK